MHQRVGFHLALKNIVCFNVTFVMVFLEKPNISFCDTVSLPDMIHLLHLSS